MSDLLREAMKRELQLERETHKHRKQLIKALNRCENEQTRIRIRQAIQRTF